MYALVHLCCCNFFLNVICGYITNLKIIQSPFQPIFLREQAQRLNRCQMLFMDDMKWVLR